MHNSPYTVLSAGGLRDEKLGFEYANLDRAEGGLGLFV